MVESNEILWQTSPWMKKNYEVVKKIGGGGFGEVYLVNDKIGKQSKKQLALKIQVFKSQEELMDAHEEASNALKLDNPNILR